MRGKVICSPDVADTIGITPAYAGKRKQSRILMPRVWDHPRVCGEKDDGTDDEEPPQGSPPRMRGKVTLRTASAVST